MRIRQWIAAAGPALVALLGPGLANALPFVPASLLVSNAGDPAASRASFEAVLELSALEGAAFVLSAHGHVANDLGGRSDAIDYLERFEIAFQAVDGSPFTSATPMTTSGALATLAVLDAENLLLSVDLAAFVDAYRASLPSGQGETFAGLAAAMPSTIDWTASWRVAVDPALGGETFQWLFASYGVTSCADYGDDSFECDGETLELEEASRAQVRLAAVPEPASALLMGLGLAIAATGHPRRSRR